MVWVCPLQLVTTPVRKNLALQIDGPPRGSGRSKRPWMEVVKAYVKKCNLSKDLAQDTSD